MKRFASLIFLSLIAFTSSSAFAQRSVGSVYVMNNDPGQNRIVTYDRLEGGALELVGRTRTDGLGAGNNAAADPLGSQNSLIIGNVGQNLYAVNAGSDSISVFSFRNDGRPRLIQVIDSRGDFPVSMATNGTMLYVLNSGGNGAIAGYDINPDGTLSFVDGSVRELSLGGSGIPVGDLRNLAPGDISYDRVQQRLVITYAGGGEAGQILGFGLNDDGTPSSNRPVKTDSEGAVPFTLNATDTGYVLVAEASGSVSSYSIRGRGRLTPISSTVANNQQGVCWVIETRHGHVYTANTLSDSISQYSLNLGGELSLVNETIASNVGLPIDMVATKDGEYLYVVSSNGGGVQGYSIDVDSGSLSDLGLFEGLPTFDADGYAPQGIAVR